MFKFKSVLANSATTGSVALATVAYLANTLFKFILAFTVAWFGWKLTSCGFWKSALGWLLLVNGAGYCLWYAFGLITFPFGVIAFSLSDDSESLPAAYRFFMSAFAFLVSVTCIVAIVFYIGFLNRTWLSMHADKIDYQNKFVILDETNPRAPQFKLYDNASKFASAVSSEEAHLKDWVLVFTSPTQKIETVGAGTFVNVWLADDEKKREKYVTLAFYEANKLFENGYVCSTFPDAKSADDILDSVLSILRKIVKQKEHP